MRRITLNSYKRKIIVFGILVFMSIGLISTGFAAWVMSTNPEDKNTGNVSVGLIHDGTLSLSLDEKPDFKIAFEGDPNDIKDAEDPDGLGYGGRIYTETNEGVAVNVESLGFTLTGKVTPTVNLGTLVYEFIIPSGVKQAIDEEYIVLKGFEGVQPTQREDKYVYTVNITEDVLASEEGAFTITIEFAWGTKFGGMNPGLYYDLDEVKNDTENYSDAACVKQLEDFRAIVCGYKDALDDATDRQSVINQNESVQPEFALNIYATSKADSTN